MMCAIMNRFRRISAAARHRPVFDSRMPVLLKPGTLTTALACPGITPAAFNSGLTQPLFTELANLLQNGLFATDQMPLRSAESRIRKQSVSNFADLLYVSNLPMTNITISLRALSESMINPEEQTQCQKLELTAFMPSLLLLFGSHDGASRTCSRRCKDKSREATREREHFRR